MSEEYYKNVKNCTVKFSFDERINLNNLIEAIEETVGYNTVETVVPMNGIYEISVSHVDYCNIIAKEGIVFENKRVYGSTVGSKIMVVSFMNIPAYISDDEILEKLSLWKVEALGDIKKRYFSHGDRQILDGTRYVRVKFPPGVDSLPYATKFDGRSFIVKHNDQSKVCYKCLKSDHEIRNCPEFVCFRCDKQGHNQRNCVEKICKTCDFFEYKCECPLNNDESVNTTDVQSTENIADNVDSSDGVELTPIKQCCETPNTEVERDLVEVHQADDNPKENNEVLNSNDNTNLKQSCEDINSDVDNKVNDNNEVNDSSDNNKAMANEKRYEAEGELDTSVNSAWYNVRYDKHSRLRYQTQTNSIKPTVKTVEELARNRRIRLNRYKEMGMDMDIEVKERKNKRGLSTSTEEQLDKKTRAYSSFTPEARI
ncbi:hypothetical protein SNE40_006336 [Patella caerulea]|uniref:CCHC-type domain-containing protein n=1 Tax=Patella caerulea TaxID=87958 RepID=A0AAN8K7N6_PATCE